MVITKILLNLERQFVFRWSCAYRNIRTTAGLLCRHPIKIIRHILRHPKKILFGNPEINVSTKFGIATIKQLKHELLNLLKENFEFFEITIPERIGHQVGEVDLWLKERILQNQFPKNIVLIIDHNKAANDHFIKYCNQAFTVVIGKQLWLWLLKSLPEVSSLYHVRKDYFHAFGTTAKCYSIYRLWEDRVPLFKLNNEDTAYLSTFLKNTLGIGEHEWFVCVHNRERGYSPSDDDIHEYRNASFDDYVPAIQQIVAKGGWVIRMGDSSMSPAVEMDKVIDYANSPYKSQRLDVLLSATARFFLGNTSGLFILATAFGVPVASANCIPMSSFPYTKQDIGIPKLLYSMRENRLLTFREVMESPAANFRFSKDYQNANLRVINNTSIEINELVSEMFELLSDQLKFTQEDNHLQKVFFSLFRQGHYGYGTASRVSRSFLQKHAELM